MIKDCLLVIVFGVAILTGWCMQVRVSEAPLKAEDQNLAAVGAPLSLAAVPNTAAKLGSDRDLPLFAKRFGEERASVVADVDAWLVDAVTDDAQILDAIVAKLSAADTPIETEAVQERMLYLDMLGVLVASDKLDRRLYERAWEGLSAVVNSIKGLPDHLSPEQRAVKFAEAYDALEIMAHREPEAVLATYLQDREYFPARLAVALANGLIDSGWTRERAYAATGL